jgi:hypothetical protein
MPDMGAICLSANYLWLIVGMLRDGKLRCVILIIEDFGVCSIFLLLIRPLHKKK